MCKHKRACRNILRAQKSVQAKINFVEPCILYIFCIYTSVVYFLYNFLYKMYTWFMCRYFNDFFVFLFFSLFSLLHFDFTVYFYILALSKYLENINWEVPGLSMNICTQVINHPRKEVFSKIAQATGFWASCITLVIIFSLITMVYWRVIYFLNLKIIEYYKKHAAKIATLQKLKST